MSLESGLVRAYLGCALWSSSMCDEDGNQTGNFDDEYDVDDFSPEAIAEATRDCTDFQAANADTLEALGYDFEQLGHDFWLSRNGHGAGFFDRENGAKGDELQRAAKVYGSVDIYVGADGKLETS